MDCRKALEENNGDYDKAIEFLREKGLAAAKKRADRVAAEGMVENYSHGGGRVGVVTVAVVTMLVTVVRGGGEWVRAAGGCCVVLA